MALSSRNRLLKNKDIKKTGLIAKTMIKLKKQFYKKNKLKNIGSKKIKILINEFKKKLEKKFNIKVEYIECRNTVNLSTNLEHKPFKIFISYYINNVRIIDNF